MVAKRIRAKERDAIIQSLKSGVTPKIGIQHIQVGRVNELKALIQDIDRISDGSDQCLGSELLIHLLDQLGYAGFQS